MTVAEERIGVRDPKEIKSARLQWLSTGLNGHSTGKESRAYRCG